MLVENTNPILFEDTTGECLNNKNNVYTIKRLIWGAERYEDHIDSNYRCRNIIIPFCCIADKKIRGNTVFNFYWISEDNKLIWYRDALRPYQSISNKGCDLPLRVAIKLPAEIEFPCEMNDILNIADKNFMCDINRVFNIMNRTMFDISIEGITHEPPSYTKLTIRKSMQWCDPLYPSKFHVCGYTTESFIMKYLSFDSFGRLSTYNINDCESQKIKIYCNRLIAKIPGHFIVNIFGFRHNHLSEGFICNGVFIEIDNVEISGQFNSPRAGSGPILNITLYLNEYPVNGSYIDKICVD